MQPGDRVAITGVYRAVPHRSNPKMRNLLSVYKTHIDVVHFRKTDQDRMHFLRRASKAGNKMDPDLIITHTAGKNQKLDAKYKFTTAIVSPGFTKCTLYYVCCTMSAVLCLLRVENTGYAKYNQA